MSDTKAVSLVERLRALPDHVSDGALAAVLLVLGLTDMFAGPGIALPLPFEVRDPDVLAVALVVLMAGSTTFRRRWPAWVLAVAGFGNIAYNGLGYPDTLGAFFPVLVALYSVAAHGSREESVWSAVITVFGMATALFFVNRNQPGVITVETVAANYVIFATAWILGDNLRHRRRYIAELEQRADQLAVQRDTEAQRAAARERARIARELHDVVAHTLSVMVVQAGAARRVADREAHVAAEALESVEEVGRQALNDMRRLLGVLRTDGGAGDVLAPQPSLAHLDGLLTKVREAGLPVEVEVVGQPRDLPAGVDLSAYRIVQEALTNTMKHAGTATAHVTIRYAEDEVAVEVVDDGRGATSRFRSEGRPVGHGLVGMRERIALYGGELRVGPRRGGGFRVRAVIPLDAGHRLTAS